MGLQIAKVAQRMQKEVKSTSLGINLNFNEKMKKLYDRGFRRHSNSIQENS